MENRVTTRELQYYVREIFFNLGSEYDEITVIFEIAQNIEKKTISLFYYEFVF